MRRTALTAVLLAVTAVPSAAGQEDGVFVDPDSPAGREYALPLEQARREAAGGASEREGGIDASPSNAQPLFGVGIERSAGGPRGEVAGAAATDGGGGSNGRSTGQGGGAASRAGDIAPNARSTAIEAAASEGSDALPTAGIAAAVLGAGLLAGIGLRRLLRDD